MVKTKSPEEIKKLEELEELEKKYKEALDKQGVFNKKTESATSLAAATSNKLLLKSKKINSEFDSKNAIELYKAGKIDFNEALKNIDKMDKMNEFCTNVAGNIATGFIATSIGLLAKGKKHSIGTVAAISIGVGAIVKPLFNILDRSLNNIKGDEFDPKKILKDAGSGAINGFFSGVNAGLGKEFTIKSAGVKIGIETLKQGGLIILQKFIQKDKKQD